MIESKELHFVLWQENIAAEVDLQMGSEITLDFDKDFENIFPPSFEILRYHNMVALSLVRPTTMPLEFKKSFRGHENSTNQAYSSCF